MSKHLKRRKVTILSKGRFCLLFKTDQESLLVRVLNLLKTVKTAQQ